MCAPIIKSFRTYPNHKTLISFYDSLENSKNKMKGIKFMIKAINYILSHLQIKNRPIYITNHGRSGTSWIGTILGKAPGILYYGEPCNPKVVKGGDSHRYNVSSSERLNWIVTDVSRISNVTIL